MAGPMSPLSGVGWFAENLTFYDTAWRVLSTLVLAWVVWAALKGIYNVSPWHPLAKFPGPKLAAFTMWWKMYVELVDETNLVDRLADLHALYGDVVRIAPNELHFSKPSAYHEIYSARNRWAKDPFLYDAFAEAESSFTILDYPRAKKRKDILLPLFSRKAIVDNNMQHLIEDCIDQMCEGIKLQHAEDHPTDIHLAFRCFALDAITSFCFAKSMRALHAPDFHSPVEHALALSLPMVTFVKYFPIIKTFTANCPDALISFLNPGIAGLMAMRRTLWDQVVEVTKHPEVLANAAHPIIYHELLHPKYGPEAVPSFTSLRDEALLLVFAGTDTSSNTLTLGAVHILSKPAIYKRLQTELREAWPRLDVKPRYEALESLPYLTAVIKESLRLSQGPLTPMTRVVPPEGAQISGTYVPGGTLVGISNVFVHLDETIFPEPYSFKPERWLESDPPDHWLVSFSKGPRSCLGINLAHCELYLGFAHLFRRFDMKLLDGVSAAEMRWKECYLPHYQGPPLCISAVPLST